MSHEWEDVVASCFGDVDCNFAVHPLDHQRATALLKRLRVEGVKYERLMGAMLAHMFSRGCSVTHMEEQIKSIEKMFKGKL